MSQDDQVPPYQVQQLIASALEGSWDSSETRPVVNCVQAYGAEIYVGCSNGELLRYVLQGQDAVSPGSYSLLSRQSLPNNKAVDDLVLVPSIFRVLVLSDRQLFFYTLPALDMIPSNVIKPIRNVVAIAVDEQHLRRPAPRVDVQQQGEPVDFCVIKRSAISLFTLRDKLWFQKEIPLPSGTTLARRTGSHLCVADQDNYNLIDLDAGLLFPVLPLSQDPSSPPMKPSITVIGENEFLVLSWTGASTLGVFITGEGDPIRGTLEWPTHPKHVAFDYPHVTSLLSDNSIQIHSIDTQAIVQTIPAPDAPTNVPRVLVSCVNGFFVPSLQRKEKLRPIAVKLRRAVDHTEAVPAEKVEMEKKEEAEEITEDIPAL